MRSRARSRNRLQYPPRYRARLQTLLPPKAAEGDSLAFFKSIAEVSSVSVGLAFVLGWSYLAAYYRTFGLNPLELDLSLPVVCTTAVYVLYSAMWPMWPLPVLVILCLGWVLSKRYVKRFPRWATVVFVTCLLFVLSLTGVFLGRRNANDDMLIGSSELPDVAFSSKLPKTDQPGCVDHETYGSLDCKLLLHSKGTYYFFTPIPKPDDAPIDSLNIYTLAESDVTGVHILRGLERNARTK